MSNASARLLDAVIQHLEGLKSSGVRFVSVTPECLAALNRIQTAPSVRKSLGTSGAGLPPTSSPRKPEFLTDLTTRTRSTIPQSVPPSATSMADAGLKLSPEAKASAFADLRQRALACTKCRHLAASRKNVVFGVGNVEARLMFVGEAPGADEDARGEPFVGKAGELLTRIIQTMGLSRETVYIANILKCRPDTPGQSSGNRKPTLEEMQTCIPFLHEQIDLIRPEVLIALGATAVEGLLGKSIGIMKMRGHWQVYRGIPLMPTFHPAYLLRNQALTEKRRVWEDMLQVMERLQMPISERQRNYFLKPA